MSPAESEKLGRYALARCHEKADDDQIAIELNSMRSAGLRPLTADDARELRQAEFRRENIRLRLLRAQ
jgi:hypothetical protein